MIEGRSQKEIEDGLKAAFEEISIGMKRYEDQGLRKRAMKLVARPWREKRDIYQYLLGKNNDMPAGRKERKKYENLLSASEYLVWRLHAIWKG